MKINARMENSGSASRFDNHMRITTFEIADNNKVFEFGEIDQYYES